MSGMQARGSGDRAAPGRRSDVLAVLRESSSPMRIADIARGLGLHPNTVRFHLDVLVGNGQAERVETAPSGPGRPPMAFRARPGMDPSGPRDYRLLAGILAGRLAAGPAPEHAAAEAGRAWGARLPGTDRQRDTEQAVTRLTSLLDDLGFAPERRPGQIGLRHCPFLELARSESTIVCQVHPGLMQGAMSAMNAPVTVGRLDPFAEPGLCLAHLNRTGNDTAEGAG
jgi:predicted ArsR family transcriptional regulator